MFTIDSSVWVNGFDRREPGYATSRQLLDLVAKRAVPIIVPTLLLVEVAAAISRTRNNPEHAHAFAIAIGNLPNVTLVPLDDLLARHALAVAAHHGLRGADAVYAAVAVQSGTTLISLDSEHLTRLQGIIFTRTPADILPDLLEEQSESEQP